VDGPVSRGENIEEWKKNFHFLLLLMLGKFGAKLSNLLTD